MCLQQVLHDVADYQDRRHYLETLKDRLEALVAPKLIAAINGHASGVCVCVRVRVRVCVCTCSRVAEAKLYVSVFIDMDRSAQLQSYYTQCHKVTHDTLHQTTTGIQ